MQIFIGLLMCDVVVIMANLVTRNYMVSKLFACH